MFIEKQLPSIHGNFKNDFGEGVVIYFNVGYILCKHSKIINAHIIGRGHGECEFVKDRVGYLVRRNVRRRFLKQYNM